MAKLPDNAWKMVKRLEDLATIIHSPPDRHSRAQISEARATFAQLRRGAGKRPGEAIEALRRVVEFFPEDDNAYGVDWERESLFLIATMFALHPTERGVAKAAKDPGELFKEMGGYEASEKRFLALLNAQPERLAWHLRQAVQLARAAQISVDYRQWLGDVLDWHDPDRRERAQMRWARSYWRSEKPADGASSSAPTPNP